MRRVSVTCMLLALGLSLAGCGDDDDNGKRDSGTGRDGGGGADGRRDGGNDGAADVAAADAATADTQMGTDAAPDVLQPYDLALADQRADTIQPLDGAADRPSDLPGDAARDTRDSGQTDSPVVVDGRAIDGADQDASTTDGASTMDTGASEVAGIDAGVAGAFVATLRGSEEVPPVATSATGSATFALSPDRTRLTYAVTHTVTDATNAHIHLGGGGEAGPVVYPLSPLSTSMSGTIILNAGDADQLEKGMFYVNVHSQANPGGEIRGQILRPGDTLWVANLTGGQEVPSVATASTGRASLVLSPSQAMVHYHVTSTIAEPLAAHIHKGVAGMDGPPVHSLVPLGATMHGTIALTEADAADLVQGRWFVNIHTTDNPDGEIRGQLLMPGEVLYAAGLSGESVVPPVTSSATGGAQLILSPSGTSLRYEAVVMGAAPTSAEIGNATTGNNGPVVFPLTFGMGGLMGTLTVSSIDVDNLNSGSYYININTAANPTGELRGQIMLQ